MWLCAQKAQLFNIYNQLLWSAYDVEGIVLGTVSGIGHKHEENMLLTNQVFSAPLRKSHSLKQAITKYP